MNHYDHPSERSTLSTSSDVAADQGRTRRLGSYQTCLLILVVLILHWIGMQCIVNWLGSEDMTVRAQSGASASAVLDDGWRRTSRGWEYIKTRSVNQHPRLATAPTQHVSLAQVWPAAAAACMLLLITSLPENRNQA